ncbi:translesion error-prone DNA polymerase V autoproteolytic subunit [Chitinophaga niabensis]|uniref:LexA family protein n=1 Tax=Chitinophaga niabensis TaxID=536979 RepID=UPI0031BAFDA3
MRATAVRNGLRFYGVELQAPEFLLPYVGPVKAGFPSPAQDFMEEDIDLVAFLGMNKPSVFIVRVDGNSMQDEHVPDKSYLIVDRSLKPQPHDLVVAVLNGEFTVKTLVSSKAGWVLYAANNLYDPIPVKDEDEFQVWGVVAQVIIDRKEMRRHAR